MFADTFIENYKSNNRIHVKSLISSIFGDLVLPNHGYTWVECISEMIAPLGCNERLVRTSLFRLCDEEWLFSTKIGRRSFYQLTDMAKVQTRNAEKQIYSLSNKPWRGVWTLLLLVKRPIDRTLKRTFINELEWSGFGGVTKNVWAFPGEGSQLASSISKKYELNNDVIVMQCKNIFDEALGFISEDQELADLCLPNNDASSNYHNFIDNFKGLVDVNGKVIVEGSDHLLLSLRLILLDEYRRAVLKDHDLPRELKPQNWIGDEAFELFKAIYNAINDASFRYYVQLQSESGASPISHRASPRKMPL